MLFFLILSFCHPFVGIEMGVEWLGWVDGWGCTISDDCPWVDRVIMGDLLDGQDIDDLARVL